MGSRKDGGPGMFIPDPMLRNMNHFFSGAADGKDGKEAETSTVCRNTIPGPERNPGQEVEIPASLEEGAEVSGEDAPADVRDDGGDLARSHRLPTPLYRKVVVGKVARKGRPAFVPESKKGPRFAVAVYPFEAEAWQEYSRRHGISFTQAVEPLLWYLMRAPEEDVERLLSEGRRYMREALDEQS